PGSAPRARSFGSARELALPEGRVRPFSRPALTLFIGALKHRLGARVEVTRCNNGPARRAPTCRATEESMLSPHAPISPPPSPASSEPLWPRAFTNLRKEQRFSPLRVTGSVPLELAGTLYWNGAALFDRLGHRSRAWIDTEGAVGAVRIGGGRAEGAL